MSESCEGTLQLTRGLREHRLEEPALRVVVVKQQLLVDAGALGNLVDTRAGVAALGELLAGGGNDA
jgi:hypothetical protein